MLTTISLPSTQRCKLWRRKILDISQKVSALHIAPAYSCVEIVDCIYFELMKKSSREFVDVFIMSKGHGCMVQYVILNSFGILNDNDLNSYCQPNGTLGAHPDFGVPGVSASTGSLGHGLGIAVGQAYAEKLKGSDVKIFCLVSDGELQEGSSWEALLMAANLKLDNLIVFVDLNDFGGLDRMSEGHPAFYPLSEKFEAFGWLAFEVDGHNNDEIHRAVSPSNSSQPKVFVCRTTKGKGISFMENAPIWHYRSPSSSEYEAALLELDN